jgi:hypothetical protein
MTDKPEATAEVLEVMRHASPQCARFTDRLERTLAAGRVATVCLTPESYAHGRMMELHVQVEQGATFAIGDTLYTAPPAEPAKASEHAVTREQAEAVLTEYVRIRVDEHAEQEDKEHRIDAMHRALVSKLGAAKASEPSALQIAVTELQWIAKSDPDPDNGDTVPEIIGRAQQALRDIEAKAANDSGRAPQPADLAEEYCRGRNDGWEAAEHRYATATPPASEPMSWDDAMKAASKVVDGPDGRGMIGSGPKHLRERVARALLATPPASAPEVTDALGWLRSALDCPTFAWDADQRAAAEAALIAALQEKDNAR